MFTLFFLGHYKQFDDRFGIHAHCLLSLSLILSLILSLFLSLFLSPSPTFSHFPFLTLFNDILPLLLCDRRSYLNESSWHLKGIPRLDAAAVSTVMTAMDQAGGSPHDIYLILSHLIIMLYYDASY